MKTVSTYTATIWVGVKRMADQSVAGYRAGYIPWFWKWRARRRIQRYVDAIGLCVTFTPTTFIYTKGSERGFAVGLINYPRFPSSPEQIRTQALDLARTLLIEFHQFKVTVVFPDETIMLNREQS